MKTILVPTDFSSNADNALAYAVALAQKGDFMILLLHAYHIMLGGPAVPGKAIDAEMKAAAKEAGKRLRGLAAEVVLTHNVKCDFIRLHGNAVDSILETIEKKKPALVIRGTKGANGIKRILVGSNTAEVVEKATRPVIAVPEKAAFHGLKRIVYATDYRNSDITALKTVAEIAELFNSRLSVAHVCDGEYTESSEKGLLKNFEDKVRKKILYPNMFFRLYNGKNVHDVLSKYADYKTTDMLVMSSHHRTLMDKLFNRSITKKLTYHSRIPLMSFHYKDSTVIMI